MTARGKDAFREYLAAEDRVYADADLTGNLRLLTLALLREAEEAEQRNSFQAAASRLGWDDQRLRYVIREDIPRYEPPSLRRALSSARPCEASMIRRAGLCEQPSSERLDVSEWSLENGTEVAVHHFCTRHADQSRRLKETLPSRHDVHRAGIRARANAGGVLMRHLDWHWSGWLRLYAWASYDPQGWVPPPGVFPEHDAAQAALKENSGEPGLDRPWRPDQQQGAATYQVLDLAELRRRNPGFDAKTPGMDLPDDA